MIDLVYPNLFQWDTGRQIQVTAPPNTRISEVHFSNKLVGESYDVIPNSNGVANIPDECLQDRGHLHVYVVYVGGEEGSLLLRTIEQKTFPIIDRAKPSGYIYTPTEQLSYKTLQASKLDKNQGAENNGKILQIGTDGMLVPIAAAEIIKDAEINLRQVYQSEEDTLVLYCGDAE